MEQSLQSVLSQDFDDFEVVVLDDGSTDRSEEIVRGIDDSRVRLVSQENGGPSKARNTGTREARGEWMVFLDADDELLPGALGTFHQLAEEHPDIEMFCCTSVHHRDGKTSEAPQGLKEGVLKNPYAALFCGYYGTHTGDFMVSRRVALACPFNEQIRRFEDVDCLFRMYKKTKVYLRPVPVLVENGDYAAASHARKDIREDFVGHLDFRGKSFWERMCLFYFFISERDYYASQARELYRALYRRYDLLLLYKIMALMNGNKWSRRLLRRFVGKIQVGG